MPLPVEDIEMQALSLPPEDRARLLERLIASSDSHKVQGALLLIDLDGFKAINDDFGHQAGDALLVEVAQRIGSEIRGEDLAARMIVRGPDRLEEHFSPALTAMLDDDA